MARSRELHKFYTSKEWYDFRLRIIAERGPRCEHCKELIEESKDIIIHHIIELTEENVGDVSISLNPDNVEIVCFDCHNKIHLRFGYKPEKRVYLVYGPPLSGKSTYVYSRRKTKY